MILFEKIPVRFEEKNYEIRVLYDDTTINVVTFWKNHPVNGFRHQAKISKQIDIEALLKMGAATDLVELCKRDILEKRWERWAAMIPNAKKPG